MADCLSQDDLRKFAAGEIAAAEMLTADSHVSECAECRGRLMDPDRLAHSVNSLAARSRWNERIEFNCLDDEQAAAYVTGTLESTDREIAAAHLELCQECRDDVSSLREFRTEMQAQPAQVFAPRARAPWFSSASGPIRRFFSAPVKLTYALTTATAVMAILLIHQFTMNGSMSAESRRLKMNVLFLRDNMERSATYMRESDRRVKLAQATIDERDRKVAGLERDLRQKDAMLASAGTSARLPKDSIVVPVPSGHELPREVARAAGELLFSGTASTRQPQQIAMLAVEGQVVRSGEKGPIPLSPAATLVRARAPYFRWTAVPGADKYVVTIFLDRPRRLLLTIDASGGTGVSYPVNGPYLAVGQTYAWRVEAHVGGRTLESPLAKFKVLSADRKREVDALMNRYSSSPLIVAAILESEGLFDEAETRLTEMARNEPTNMAAKRSLDKLLLSRRTAGMGK
jgi:hypothetical protein